MGLLSDGSETRTTQRNVERIADAIPEFVLMLGEITGLLQSLDERLLSIQDALDELRQENAAEGPPS